MITFTVTNTILVEESVGETRILSGTFLKLAKPTSNGREYLIEEGQAIADGLLNMDVNYGANWMGKHIKDASAYIGKVVEAIFDKATNTIKGKIQVWNTPDHPDLVSSIRNGWGFSIGGVAKSLIPTGAVNALGRAIVRVLGMVPNHLQLLNPNTRRGQNEAQVEEGYHAIEESFEIEESEDMSEDIKTLAQKAFNKNKKDLIYVAKSKGMSGYDIERLEEIQDPNVLEGAKIGIIGMPTSIASPVKKDDVLPQSSPSNPPKHSVATLPPKAVVASKDWEYNSMSEAVADIYAKAEAGDPKAEELREKLWTMATPEQFEEMNRKGFVVSGCPNPACNGSVTGGESICSFCGDPVSKWTKTIEVLR